MAGSTQYKLRSGEHLNTVAEHFGFGSLEPIVNHPDNQALISERGGVDRLRSGDIVTIPEGTAGKKNLAPGRGHVLKVKRIAGSFTLIVEGGFRLQDPARPGDITGSPYRWKAFSGALKVIGATSKLAQVGGGPMYTNTTDRQGRLATPLLGDGEWTLELEPVPAERSPGPAAANPAGGHWLEKGSTAPKPTPGDKFFEAEYQPLKIKFTVSAGAVSSARVESPIPKDRPVPAVLFWKGLGENKDRQFLFVDWKADFLRRIAPTLRPLQYKRPKSIDTIVIHITTGEPISSGLSVFLGKANKSGAHFVLDTDGHIVRLADDHCYTQHAGGYGEVRDPYFDGVRVNDRAIGIECCHSSTTDLDPSKNPFTDAQYTTLIGLIADYRAKYPAIPLRNVIGHQDATPKANCPGPQLDWPRLEEAGVALAPLEVEQAELETMFGGFFAGEDGRKRCLHVWDEEAGTAGEFRVVRKGQVIAEHLRERPIECVRRALDAIGYDPSLPIRQGGKTVKHKQGTLGVSLAFCLAQFIRHFATGARIRADQPTAYLEIALGKSERFNKVVLDFKLAKLLRGAELAAHAFPRSEREPIEVDQ